MPLGAPRAGLMRRPPPGLPELPELPAGFAFVVDAGAYVTDAGNFVIDAVEPAGGTGEPWGDDETFPFWDDDTGWIDD